jgi:hypothetical protein
MGVTAGVLPRLIRPSPRSDEKILIQTPSGRRSYPVDERRSHRARGSRDRRWAAFESRAGIRSKVHRFQASPRVGDPVAPACDDHEGVLIRPLRAPHVRGPISIVGSQPWDALDTGGDDRRKRSTMGIGQVGRQVRPGGSVPMARSTVRDRWRTILCMTRTQGQRRRRKNVATVQPIQGRAARA